MMSPPLAYHNTAWGRAHTLTSTPSSPLSPSYLHTRSPQPRPPIRRSESAPQTLSPSPRRGAIHELPATRVEGYGKVMRDSSAAGVAPPSRESVKFYSSRPLPPTPSSTVSSVAEATVLVPPSPSCGVKACHASKSLPPTPGSAVVRVFEMTQSRRQSQLRVGGRKTSITAREVTLGDGSGRIGGVVGRIYTDGPPYAPVDPDLAFAAYNDGLTSPVLSARSNVASSVAGSLDALPPYPISEPDFEPYSQSKLLALGQRMKRMVKGLSCSRAG